jgi:hypothetical protein
VIPHQVEVLWAQLARRSRNVNPLLDFLLASGGEAASQVGGRS